MALLLVTVLAACGITAPSSSATTSPPVAATATATSTTSLSTAQPTTTATPSSANSLYVNTEYRFSVALPSPYRKSARLSLATTSGQRPVAHDAFTARTDPDEGAVVSTNCETACPIWNYVAVVIVNTGAGSQTPRDWYTSSGGAVGQTIEDVTVDGRQAIKVTNGSTYELQYFVKDADRMFRLGYLIYPLHAVPAGATKGKLEQILAGFRFTP
jgi:hypothetical protein